MPFSFSTFEFTISVDGQTTIEYSQMHGTPELDLHITVGQIKIVLAEHLETVGGHFIGYEGVKLHSGVIQANIPELSEDRLEHI